jgi:prolyl oligopeptidase
VRVPLIAHCTKASLFLCSEMDSVLGRHNAAGRAWWRGRTSRLKAYHPHAVEAGAAPEPSTITTARLPADSHGEPAMSKLSFLTTVILVLSAILLLSGLTGCIAVAAQKPAAPGPPVAAKQPVVDTYFGTKVTDDYRWLEDSKSPEVQSWSDAQNAWARRVLAQLPNAAAIRERVRQLETGSSADYLSLLVRGHIVFALKQQPPKQQPLLVALKSPDDLASERVLLDPNVLDPTGATRIDFYVPSLDGSKVAVSLSERGTESGTVRVLETATGTTLPDRIPRVNGGTAGGSVAWNADGSGLYYTRYPRHGEGPTADMDFFQQVYFHKLGTHGADDTYELGEDFPRIAETVLTTSEDGRYVLASVANGDGGEFAHFLRRPGGTWVQFTHFADGIVAADFSADGGIYLLSHKDASRGRILRVPLEALSLENSTVVVAEGEPAIQGFLVTPDYIYVRDVIGGPSQVRIFKRGGTHEPRLLPLPPDSAVSDLARLDKDSVVYRVESYTEPPAWYRYDPASGKATRTSMVTTSPASFADCEVVRALATSEDGTRVPISILRRKGIKLDHSNPTLLTSYGGFSIVIAPHFSAGVRTWLDQGGVYAVANIRGGGEYGEAWHDQGMLTHKQNGFDDFAACAAYLINTGYTSRDKLAIEGGSNGGLLMGAMITQHPELVRAVVAYVGLFDMLRFEQFPNGQFNVTEYGSVSNEKQFKAIYAYSPYQHVVNGTKYPACLFLTGANDPRVDPANSRKMVARLQAATASKLPVLLRTSSSTGHIGTPLDERIAEDADVYAFLFHELGVKYTPVAAAKPGSKEATP